MAISNYQTVGKLKNPVNDGRLMRDSLKTIGFDVIYREDLSSLQMKGALREFRSKLSSGDIGLVYFSGHGAQVDNENFLIPTDLKVQYKYELKSQCLGVNEILAAMEGARTHVNLVFLDCCRNIPSIPAATRSGGAGLGEIKTESESTLVSFSTKHGMVALDSPHLPNSHYTTALSQELVRPGLVIEEAMRRVAKTVVMKSQRRQRPWTYGNLLDPIYLAGKTGPTPPPVNTLPPRTQPTTPKVKPTTPSRPNIPSLPKTNPSKFSLTTTERSRIRNHRSTSASQVYFGQFGERQAAVSLQWLSDIEGVRGSIFFIDDKEFKTEYQFIGTNYVQGEIDIEIWHYKKLITTGSLFKQRQGDTLIWSGRTTSDENIKLGRLLQRKPAPTYKSTYSGKIGSSNVRVTLNWGSDRRVTGSYKSLTSGKTYQLSGDNTVDGFIYLDEFSKNNISARIILHKTRVNGKVAWAGRIFNPDGRINPVTIFRQ